MFKLITWNIQSGRAPSGAADLDRVVGQLTRFSEFDVLCLQEVACGFPARDGKDIGDQFAGLASRLQGYRSVRALAVDTLAPAGGRRRMGNMVFSRFPILQVLRHSLPWPADHAVMSMPRVALEVTLDTPVGLLRVVNVHLEYFSERQRLAQVDRLRELHAEACAHARAPRPGDASAGPFAAVPRPARAVLAGDFNMLPESPGYRRMLEPFANGTPALHDAWRLAWPGRRHAPTVGLHDDNPGAAPFAFDYLFASSDLAERVHGVRIDVAESGSDHQPVLLELE